MSQKGNPFLQGNAFNRCTKFLTIQTYLSPVPLNAPQTFY